jgi:hypothetical protein
MINFLLKYLGVYGLLGAVAIAVIVPSLILYSSYLEPSSKNDAVLGEQDQNTSPASNVLKEANDNSEIKVPKSQTKEVSKSGSETENIKEVSSNPIQPVPENEPVKKELSESSVAKETKPQTNAKTEKNKKANLSIDVFRVDKFGNILTAGNISEDAQIEIISSKKEVLGSAKSQEDGNFVVFGKIQGNALVQTVKIRGLLKKHDSKNEVISESLFFVLPQIETDNTQKKEEIKAPTIVKDDGNELKVIMPITSDSVDSITLDTISYRADTASVLAGRARTKHSIRLYLDNNFIVDTPVEESGGWLITLSDINAGIYKLRLDEVDVSGKVQGRLELPFKRESESLVQAMGEGSITVQPGNSLWRIARMYYGRGIDYVEIFNRNSHLIKDPDLIFPGQIFSLPN